jgi:hypothetical protein
MFSLPRPSHNTYCTIELHTNSNIEEDKVCRSFVGVMARELSVREKVVLSLCLPLSSNYFQVSLYSAQIS